MHLAGKREGIRGELRRNVLGQLKDQIYLEDEQLYDQIDAAIRQKGREVYLPLKERLWLRNSLYDSFRRLDILQELLDDKEVTEIMINGAGKIFIEKKGKMLLWNRRFEKTEQLEDIIQQIVGKVNRIVNVSSPIADARLEDGSRVHIVLPPVALDGPVVTIRKFPEPVTIEKLIRFQAITEEAAAFLEKLVEARYNIFVSGGTNSGKTTFLNALSSFIPEQERVITIEDSAELQIRHVPNLVRMETRNANTEGEGEITISQLIKASLRMNPSRIIVGEVRGGEALDMLQAMNTGHPGSLSTGHGNSPQDMLSRLETMVFMGIDLQELWRYRDLIIMFVKRNFTVLYKQTILGPAWIILNPLITTVIFNVVFGGMANMPTDGVPGFLFYMAGNTVWTFFANCVNNTANTFVTNSQIFGKVYFPRLTMPVSQVLTSLINFGIQAVMYLIFWVYFFATGSGVTFTLWVLAVPFVVLEVMLLGLGVGIIVSSLTTKYRDLAIAVGFGVQLWMYASPVVYPLSMLDNSPRLRVLVQLNPMTSPIEIFRMATLGTGTVTAFGVVYSLIFTAAALVLGVVLFSRIEKTFMDTV